MGNYNQEEEQWLKDCRQEDISEEALQDGCLGTALTLVLSMVAFEVANLVVGSKISIPRELVVPALSAIQFPEFIVACIFSSAVGRAIQKDRSLM